MIAANLVADDKAKKEAIQDLESKFDLSTDQLRKLSLLLQNEMKSGLKKCDIECNVPMLPSWVFSHPTGQEQGEYIGLDLSGKKNK